MEYHASSARALIEGNSFEQPVHVFRPHAIDKAARFFIDRFPGRICFAVKTNPEPRVLKRLHLLGLRSFDVASVPEIQAVKKHAPDSELFFMHTVKSRASIRAAYFEHGVRNFSLDSEEELTKIMQETQDARDLNIFVRLAIPNTYAEMNLSDKFGIDAASAQKLLVRARPLVNRLGVCFHVGSQCMHPDAYRMAMRACADLIDASGVMVDMLDVGGGFPSVYPGMMPPSMQSYFDAIEEEFAPFKLRGMELICEPGRALVAESGSVVVRVELRKGNNLYINDGTYGSLFDAGTPRWVFPVQMLRPNAPQSTTLVPFSFFGPTCDTLDFMKGPFMLPEDIGEGDYIEIGQLGAYSRTLASSFNGFVPDDGVAIVEDAPLMTMYEEDLAIPALSATSRAA